mgnify:CR=1 FL=1
MTEIKRISLQDTKKDNSESEGPIQELFLNENIVLKSAQVRESTKTDDKGVTKTFKVAFIHLEDSTGKTRICNSSSIAIVSECEKLLEKGLGKTIKVPVRCVKVVRAGKNDYFKLDKV